MSSFTVPAFYVGQYILFNVLDYEPDGVTLDTTEALTVASNQPAIASVVVMPTDNRQVKITGLAPGTSVVTVSAPGVPTARALSITITITAVPLLSKIEPDGPTPYTGPFAV